jgi:hypothetical protein
MSVTFSVLCKPERVTTKPPLQYREKDWNVASRHDMD